MKKRLLALLLFFLTFSTSLFAQWEIPLIDEKSSLIYHQGFCLNYSEEHEQAIWVAYCLTPATLDPQIKRKNLFRFDPSVSTGSATPNDYKKSGYDRGHLAPAADMKGNEIMLAQSFYMSNISPQLPQFNRGIWKRLEEWVRSQAQHYEELYIVTGPLFTFPNPVDLSLPMEKEKQQSPTSAQTKALSIGKKSLSTLFLESEIFSKNHPPIGFNQVTVPFGFYKAILKNREPKKMIAFFIPQESNFDDDLFEFTLSVDLLEIMTQINFFPLLADEEEEALERENQFALWK